MVELTVNGKKIKAREEATILDVCNKMSIPIPTLCYHPDLAPHGACRLCTVEVSDSGRTRMVTACNFPVQEGIRVETHSPGVLQARRVLIELLLARCPRAKIIQDLAMELGVEAARFKTNNPENNCILCGLCVRTCEEIVGAKAIGFSKRGTEKKIGTPFEIDNEKCVACGACEYICPTGVVKMEMDRIRKIKLSDTGTERHCRYMRLGLIDFMVCSNGFECWRCDVDQAMEDRFGTHPAFAIKPAQKRLPVSVSGFTFVPDLHYSEGHVWAKTVDRWIRLGLDDLASQLAMDARSIELPAPGMTLKKGDVLGEIMTNGKKGKILSPMGGTVLALNHDVREIPSLVWKDAYQRGWLVMLQAGNPGDLWTLLYGEKAREWFARQATDLANRFIEWAPNPAKKEGFSDQELIRGIVRDHWEELRTILLK